MRYSNLDQRHAAGGASLRSTVKRDVLCAGIVLAVLALSMASAAEGNSADLLALYAASLFHASGEASLVYPADTEVFTMLPPAAWYPAMQEIGYEGELYPYLYPPLWVALFGTFVDALSLDALILTARIVNHALLVLSIWLAWRIAGRPLPLSVFLAVGAAICFLTLPGVIGLRENQPQILVGALILLAIERQLAGSWGLAGIALAVAAAIKGYPALLALIWLFARDWRSFAAFFGTGAARLTLMQVTGPKKWSVKSDAKSAPRNS